MSFTIGILKGRRVVLANVGYGKVNAAMTATLLINHLDPSEILFTGIAGGLNPDLNPGDIVIGSETAQHDYMFVKEDGLENMATRNPVSGEKNPVFLPADRRLLEVARKAGTFAEFESIPLAGGGRMPRIIEGIIVTGDAFIASSFKKRELRERLHADAVEMEGAAVAQVCFQMGTPCLVIRSISDLADSSAVDDIEKFYRIAANNSASLVMTIVELLAEDPLGGNH